SFSKLHDEEEPASLLDHDSNGSTIELVAPGMGWSTRHDAISSDDESDNERQTNITRNRKKRTIGQLSGGFISISQLAHEEPSRTATPDTSRSSNEHEEAEAVADAANEANMGPDPADFKSDLKCRLYFLMEQPSSSSAAFWTNVIVSMLIVLSAVMTTIETIPTFRSTESNSVWFKLETTMVALFTIEYLVRVFAHTDSLRMLGRFFISPLSIIDFIAIMPFYIELLASRDTTYEFRFTILRLFRLLRLFKSYKYSNTIIMTIEVMVVALRRSSDALYALFFFLVTSIVLIATLLYFAERGVWDENLKTFVDPSGDPSVFDSIPAAFWFVLVTITTTGYGQYKCYKGDMVPATFIGKLITFPAMLFGLLLIALPSIIIGRNFTIVWEAMKRRQYYSQLMTDPEDGGPGGPDTQNEPAQAFSTPPQPNNPMSPPTSQTPGFFDNGDDAILNQLQTLMVVTRQNQEAIQHILSVLEKQQRKPSNFSGQDEFEADIGQPTTTSVRKRSQQYSSNIHINDEVTHHRHHHPQQHQHHEDDDTIVENSSNSSNNSSKGKSAAISNQSNVDITPTAVVPTASSSSSPSRLTEAPVPNISSTTSMTSPSVHNNNNENSHYHPSA
ncbi:hypothetical protein INT45_001131, partial [Circinella minor]